jgi:hypothetical protein
LSKNERARIISPDRYRKQNRQQHNLGSGFGLRADQEGNVFRVDVDNLAEYFNFDPRRKIDLQKLVRILGASAPGLKRYFDRGAPDGEPGMRFKMIGHGRFQYLARAGKYVVGPAVGVALQRNYISVYLSLTKDCAPLIQSYVDKLGVLRIGHNSSSVGAYGDLDIPLEESPFAEADQIFSANSRRCAQEYAKTKRRATD